MPPQTAEFGAQPAPGFAQPVAPPMQGSFADQQPLPVEFWLYYMAEKISLYYNQLVALKMFLHLAVYLLEEHTKLFRLSYYGA